MSADITEETEVQNMPDWRVLGLYHVNINVRNLGASQRFYEALGFEVVDSFSDADDGSIAYGLGLGEGMRSNTRALFMKVGTAPHATVLDLCEWIEPRAHGEAADIRQFGIPRICLRAKNLDALVEDLSSQGVEFITDRPQVITTLARSPRFICCKDPDGVIVEFVEL